jgi:hypothetical protein
MPRLVCTVKHTPGSSTQLGLECRLVGMPTISTGEAAAKVKLELQNQHRFRLDQNSTSKCSKTSSKVKLDIVPLELYCRHLISTGIQSSFKVELDMVSVKPFYAIQIGSRRKKSI